MQPPVAKAILPSEIAQAIRDLQTSGYTGTFTLTFVKGVVQR